MNIPSVSLWFTLLVSGLLGSLGHCLGMCGPLNLMVAAQMRKNNLSLLPNFSLYHAARVLIYVLLGAFVGGLGSLLGLSRQLTTLGGVVSLLLGIAILLLGAGYLGLLRAFPLEGASRWWNAALSRALKQGGWGGVALLGALNGLLPCGLVYSALLLVASTGSLGYGALGMALFGLGTFPALLALDLGAGAVSARFRQGMMKLAGVLMLLVGLQLALRGGAALHFWSHLHWRGIAIW
ncbi:sulfite exporter TauE/SafE family protein [bacterium]|nr:sulfite exporter TauE/SafE family protein [bacterium]